MSISSTFEVNPERLRNLIDDEEAIIRIGID
ncbi:MAG: hypothetical protein ACJAVI_001336 [Candidatus Azotimanducaceae bacterium]